MINIFLVPFVSRKLITLFDIHLLTIRFLVSKKKQSDFEWLIIKFRTNIKSQDLRLFINNRDNHRLNSGPTTIPKSQFKSQPPPILEYKLIYFAISACCLQQKFDDIRLKFFFFFKNYIINYTSTFTHYKFNKL